MYGGYTRYKNTRMSTLNVITIEFNFALKFNDRQKNFACIFGMVQQYHNCALQNYSMLQPRFRSFGFFDIHVQRVLSVYTKRIVIQSVENKVSFITERNDSRKRNIMTM